MHIIRIILVIILIPVSLFSQNFQYKEVENTYGKFAPKPSHIYFAKVEDYLPDGYVKDGTKDYYKEIQKAIDENKNVEFPDFPVMISGAGLQLRDSSNVFFQENSKLILAPNNKTHYGILTLKEIQDVDIYNPTLIGDRKKHKGNEGQWGMGVKIHNAKNINVYNSDIKDTWGDGIYVKNQTKEKDSILIRYGSIDNVRRNGISIISGKDVFIDSIQISNTNGHNPASGIDVEPNTKKNIIDNLILKNLLTYNNEHDGIILNFMNLIRSGKHNSANVSILNHIDKYSRYGLGFTNSKKTGRSLYGEVKIKNSKYLNTKQKKPLRFAKESRHLPSIKFLNIQTNNMRQEKFDQYLKESIKNKRKLYYDSGI